MLFYILQSPCSQWCSSVPVIHVGYMIYRLVGFMVFNATFNNISVMLWRSVLLVEETRVPIENHQPITSNWQTWSHNVVSSIPRLSGVRTHNFTIRSPPWWPLYDLYVYLGIHIISTKQRNNYSLSDLCLYPHWWLIMILILPRKY